MTPSSSRRNESALSAGEGTSIERPTEPSRRSRPARIFVPPTSTPMTRSGGTARLPYPGSCPLRTSRTGCIGAAGPRGAFRSRDTTQGRSAPGDPARPQRRGSAVASVAGSSSGSSLLLVLARRLGRRQLPLGLERRRGGERPRARGRAPPADEDGRDAALDADDDPRARERRRQPRRARGREPRGLDHAAAHGPGKAPPRVPLHPARPPGRDPGGRARRRSTPPTRSAARRSRSAR